MIEFAFISRHAATDGGQTNKVAHRVNVGDIVQWDNGRKPLGTVVLLFTHKGMPCCVVETTQGNLKVCRINDKLQVIR